MKKKPAKTHEFGCASRNKTKKVGQKRKASQKKLRPPLFSRQWISESTVQLAPDPPPDGSPSASGAPPPSCDKDTYEKSADLGEIKVVTMPVDVVLDDKGNATTFAGMTDVFPFPGHDISELEPILGCDTSSNSWKYSNPAVTAPVIVMQILNGREKLTADIIAATTDCNVLKQMRSDVKILAQGIALHRAKWVPIGWILAHEQVHAGLMQQSYQTRYNEYVSTLDGITADCSSNSKKLEKLKKDAEKAKTTFYHDLWADDKKNSNHEPRQPFLDAVAAVCNPLLQNTRDRMRSLKCK